MGKSTSSRLLAERGVAVIDTDILARQLVEPGQPALAEIQDVFGSDIIAADGRLRRGDLASKVFGNDSLRVELESILHPRIRKSWLEQVAAFRKQGIAECVIVIPLLFETKADSEFDYILCVACSAGAQHQRLSERGWTAAQIQARIASQWPIEKKMDLSRFVIWTEGSLASHSEQLDRILTKIRH